MPGPVDLILVAVIVIGVPLEAMRERRRLERDLAAGVPDARLAAYRRIMLMEWGMAAVLLAFWAIARRELSLLGVVAPSGRRFGIATAIALGIMALLYAQLRAVRRRPQLADQVRAAAAPVAYVLPTTPPEMRRFSWVSATAGIVEELIYRGYLMWYFAAFGPMWMALVVSALLFGLGHAYQGATGVAKTGAAGLFLGVLYWIAGSLWVPIAVHAVVDALNGRMVYDVTRQPDASEAS